MPPWWLILAWVIIVPMAVVMLVNPQRLWNRPALAWARDHPDDRYTRGWVAAGVLRAVTGLLIVGISTVAWLHHAHTTAQPRLPHTDSTEKVTAHPGPPPLVAIAPDMYARHGKGLRVAWRSWAERLDCRFDHLQVDESSSRVTVIVYEAGAECAKKQAYGSSGSFGPFTTRYTDVALRSPLKDRDVANADGAMVPPLPKKG